jgi:hypothetical protein
VVYQFSPIELKVRKQDQQSTRCCKPALRDQRSRSFVFVALCFELLACRFVLLRTTIAILFLRRSWRRSLVPPTTIKSIHRCSPCCGND